MFCNKFTFYIFITFEGRGVNDSEAGGGDWVCSCGMSNFASRFSCRGCKSKKKGGNSSGNSNKFKIFIANLSEKTTGDDLNELFSKHGTVLEAIVVPDKYFGFIHIDSEKNGKAAIEALNGHNLHGNELNVKASKSRDTVKNGSAAGINDGGDWNCQGCGFSNFASRSACFKCKNNSDGTPGNGGDEWTCPNGDCGFSNFSTRRSCYKCKTPNPNGGGTPAKPGDWNCSCGFSNFASRFECFKCKSAKDGGNKKITFDD